MAFWRRRADEDFSDEVQAHLDLETERLIADGWAPEAARAAARKAFGNVLAARERFHESSRWMWLEQFTQDLRYAWRGLSKSPSFLATAVLTLAVGLGLLTVAFTVFNAYVLRPFAVRDPSSLYRVAWRSPDSGGQSFTWRDFRALRDRTDLFDAVIAEDTRFVRPTPARWRRPSSPTTTFPRSRRACSSAGRSGLSTSSSRSPCSDIRRGCGCSRPIPWRLAVKSISTADARSSSAFYGPSSADSTITRWICGHLRTANSRAAWK